jgi:hypothetical protein
MVEKPDIPFRCIDVDGLGASPDGQIAVVEIVEVNGQRLMIHFAPEYAQILANRFQAAADIAHSRMAAGPATEGQYKAPPAPVVTNLGIQLSDDTSTLVITFRIGSSEMSVRLSATWSAALRAQLETAETMLAQRQKETRN